MLLQTLRFDLCLCLLVRCDANMRNPLERLLCSMNAPPLALLVLEL